MANDLEAVRQKLVDLTGRVDLVVDTTDYVDNGANWFIQAAQRWLDQRLDTANAVAEITSAITAGDYYVDLDNIRAILSVQVVTDDDLRYLRRETVKELRERFTDDDTDFSDVDQDVPAYYALLTKRDDSPAAQADESQKRIVFLPPSDGSYSIVVTALLSSPALSADASYSWWTIMRPEILVKAAAYQIEVFYRNTEGARDWLESLMLDIQGIDFDSVAESIAGVDQMKDSW